MNAILTAPFELPVTWQASDGLSLHFLPKRQALQKFAPAAQHVASESPYDSSASLPGRAKSLRRKAEKMENDSRLNRGLAVIALEWVATSASMRANVTGGQFIITSFLP